MSAVKWQALRASPCPVRVTASRFVAGRRLGSRSLNPSIHTSFPQLAENEPKDPPEGSWQPIFLPSSNIDDTISEQQRLAGGPDDGPEKPSKQPDLSHYGSALRRQWRNRKPKDLPQVPIPDWLLDRNVVLLEETRLPAEVGEDIRATKTAQDNESPASTEQTPSTEPDELDKKIAHNAYEESPETYLRRQLRVHANTTSEIASLVQAGLRIPDRENAPNVTLFKPHILLSCPRKGATAYMSSFVRDIAHINHADFLRLNPQDLAEVGGDYLEYSSGWGPNSLKTLGYDVAQIMSSQGQPPPESYAEQDEMEPTEDDEYLDRPRDPPKMVAKMVTMPISVGVAADSDLGKLIQQMLPRPESKSESSPQPTPQSGHVVAHMRDDTPDMKETLFMETLLNAADLKRARARPQEPAGDKAIEVYDNGQRTEFADVQRGYNSLVVLIDDYSLINLTPQGGRILDKLHQVVEARRKDGQPVLIIGTSSSEKILGPGDSKNAIDDVQAQPWDRLFRNVIVPIKSKSDEGLLWLEHKRKVREINLRHLRDMLWRTAPNGQQVKNVKEDWNITLDSKYAFVANLDRSVWPMHKVSRIATVAHGLLPKSEHMSAQTIEKAIAVIDGSDTAKYKWHQKDTDKVKSKEGARTASANQQDQAEYRMKKLRKKCNPHEKKLLNGVVDANSIRTTFADVQAPPETIEALKTLTSLSLLRPDAFTYGVLATDRIPGILLYGPPGTGKTLLAKAVAKESGATVLEVSGSDVYDMYVGEGEKNIKAIFSLAKKLSPCVVFIDEADAILGSRSSGPSRTSHRELINQFLREWDGMTDTSAFIMVATNRPFDLDEASLRRVPRRLLVDLPVEKDREAILGIHLKDEVLDPEVSIPQLAAQTPFYSGSDLKNLCVATALACVREEYETKSAHDRGKADEKEEYKYAEKRTLAPRHFTKAMEEISASISEDMGSLSAIRKFDEKYGDRRGRRKKLGGYGFKTVNESEKMGSDAARVRNRT